MFKKAVQRGRSKRGGEAYRGPVALRSATGELYGEPLRGRPIAFKEAMGAPTKLGDFFNILLRFGGRWGLRLLDIGFHAAFDAP